MNTSDKRTSWPVIEVGVPPELEEACVSLLMDLGCLGTARHIPAVESDDLSDDQLPIDSAIQFKAYFSSEEDRNRALQALDELATGVAGSEDRPTGKPVITFRAEDCLHRDWHADWRATLNPFAVGSRFLIVPTEESGGEPDRHSTPNVDQSSGAKAEPRAGIEKSGEPSRIVLRLIPGMAFGTGDHPTTRFCLEALEKHAGGADRFLDAGTGSGILTVAALALGCRTAVAFDKDPAALGVARRTFADHGVGQRVDLQLADSAASLPGGPFPLVAANILSGVLMKMADDLAGPLLAPGGVLLLAGVLEGEDGERVIGRYCGLGLQLIRQKVDGEWLGLELIKRA